MLLSSMVVPTNWYVDIFVNLDISFDSRIMMDRTLRIFSAVVMMSNLISNTLEITRFFYKHIKAHFGVFLYFQPWHMSTDHLGWILITNNVKTWI